MDGHSLWLTNVLSASYGTVFLPLGRFVIKFIEKRLVTDNKLRSWSSEN